MKPAFALDFRDDAIGLLHRTGAGWTQIGSVAIDDPDLTQALGYLRSTALGLSPRGIATKLIIPNDQILYLTLTAPGPDAAKRRAQIVAALEGRTPYDVADLVFDWSGSGPEVQVAVIARETLAEAAGFAAEHRFNPVSFVAAPDEGTYKGEPWFGPTEMAADLLAAGEKVDRDKVAVTIASRAPAPNRKAAETSAPAMPPAAELAAETAAEPATSRRRDPADTALGIGAGAPAPAAAMPVDLPPFRAEDVPMRPSRPDTAADTPTVDPRPDPAPTPMPEPIPAPMLMPDAVPGIAADDPPREMSFAEIMAEARAELPVIPEPAAPALASSAEPEEAPMALDVPAEDSDDPRPASVLDARIDDDLPPEPSLSARVAFSSRRQPGDDTGAGVAATAPPPVMPAVARPAIAKPIAAFGAGFDRTAAPTSARPTVAAPPPRPSTLGKPSVAGKALRGLGALVTAPGIAGSKTRKAPVPQIAGASQSPALPAARSPTATAPSRVPPPRPGIGLGGKQAAVRGKPRHLGLALTLLLLLCLAAVAAWSSFSLASWTDAAAPAEAVVDGAASPDASDFPAPEDEMAADMQDPADFADLPGDTAEITAAVPLDPAADLAVTETTTETATEAEMATEAAAEFPPPAPAPAPQTGVTADAAAGNSPNPEPQDEILLATMDAPPITPDPLSLPQPDARGDPQPAPPPAPPPFGTVYTFDADGLIVPTPEGIITPEGVLLIAGKPPIVPAARPASLAGADTATPVTDAPLDPALVALDPALDPALAPVLPVDPALVGKRSKPRPATLAPVVSPEDDAALAPASDSRFAGLRPRLRPAEVLAAGDAARIASASASLVAVADPALPPVDLLEGAAQRSPMAVAISRKPEPRPRDLSRAVEAAVAAAIRTPDLVAEPAPETQAAAPDADASPEADNEPELASAAPSIPTKASVAKQATFKNAINLAKINLIGVYGTQSSRYALVRQANGRYKKVKVGDKIDGGQIAAITATEVRYKKGNKMLTLAMPKS